MNHYNLLKDFFATNFGHEFGIRQQSKMVIGIKDHCCGNNRTRKATASRFVNADNRSWGKAAPRKSAPNNRFFI